jgi:pantoate--beta-alanine ligase
MKDYQQLKVVEKLVQDLHFGCEVVGVETVREKDGLALSSRNQYLSEKGRKAAAVIFKGLSLAKASFDEGERDPEILKQLVRSEIDDHTEDVDSEVDYIEIYEADSLEDPEKGPPWVLAVAVFIEKSRLIDNIRLK